ncbi:MAG: pyrroline-5-carboxylate reductase [Defluviitaleaceae bacterium]|nr:pyrroline-5-carboxylate reductase [Defluviitaleaceae bacterium]
MTKKLGFIGAGNMAEAIIAGAIKAGAVTPSDIIASDMDKARLSYMAEKHGVVASKDNATTAQSEIIFLSIKPHIYDAVISEIKATINPNALVIIIAAGISISYVKERLGGGKIIKTMPNTPAMVNHGMTAVCASENVTESELAQVLNIFNSVGKTEILPERLFDAYTALAGSSPAYAFMFIEAMADAGVKHGLPRAQALQISTQALLGAAKMLQETNEHPAKLRDAVCSPGGTTIAAVCELEKNGFRNAVISAITACVEKYNKMS